MIKGGSYGFQEIFSDGLSDDGDVPYLSFHRGNQIGWQQGLLGNDFVIARGSGANVDNLFPDKYFTITDGGRVGIGSVTPRYGLDVSGQMISSGTGSQYIMQETDNPINVNDLWHLSYNTGNFGMYWENASNPGFYEDRFFIDSLNGNVGIGTTTPQAKLHVKEDTLLIETSLPNQAAHLFLKNEDHTWQIESDSGPAIDEGLSFDYSKGAIDNNYMIIKTDGKVGIGTRTPTAELEVNGDIKANNLYSNGDKVATENYVDSKVGAGSFAQGSHCGIYVNGAHSGVNGVVNCQGHNPSVSCPAGFSRYGGDFQSPGDRFFFTCVKT